jgi:large subunit ribosomal protein L25
MASTSKAIVVEVEPRRNLGKNHSRRMRREGRVPANVYGMELKPFAVSVDPRRIEDVLRLESGRNTILTLAMSGAGQSREVMLREMQRDPVSEKLVHIDFVRVDPTKALHVAVPVRLLGTATGVKNEAGVLDFVHRQVEVSCLPVAIPEHLDVDISELHIGQHVSVKDLAAVANVEFLDDPETILAVVSAPRVEEVPAAAAEEEAEAAEAPEAEAEAGTGKEAEPSQSESDKS